MSGGDLTVGTGFFGVSPGITFDSTAGVVDVAAGRAFTLQNGASALRGGGLLGTGTVRLDGSHVATLSGELVLNPTGLQLALPGSVTVRGTGVIVNRTALTLSSDALDVRVVNEGTLTSTGSDRVGSGLENAAGGLVRIDPGQSLLAGGLEVRGGFENGGRVELGHRPGAIFAQPGRLIVTDGGLRNFGTLAAVGPDTYSARVVTGGVDNYGRIEAVGGSLAFDGGTATFRNPTGTVVVAAGRWLGLRTPLGDIVEGTLTGGAWELNGDLTLTDFGFTRNAATLTIGPTATVTNSFGYHPLAFLGENVGTLTLTGGADLTTGGSFTNSGTLTLGAGSVLSVSAFTQTAGGVLDVGIGGPPGSAAFGRVSVTGRADLGGRVNVRLTDGFAAADGQRFDVVSGNSLAAGGVRVAARGFAAEVGAKRLTVAAVGSSVDLEALAVVAPAELVPGRPFTLSYTVRNTAADAAGGWDDAVYLVPDGDPTAAVLLGRFPHAGGLATGASYTNTLNLVAPAVLPGTYRLRVVADVRGQLSDRQPADNAADSAVSVSVPTLTPGVPLADTLPAGGERFYQLAVEEGVPLTVTAGGPFTLGVASGRLPTAADFDAQQAGGRLVVPADRAGVIYLRVNGSAGGYTLTAAPLPFGVEVSGRTEWGNGGVAVLELTGAWLDLLNRVSLRGPDGAEVPASAVTLRSRSAALAGLDLTGRVPGRYDLLAGTSDGRFVTLPGVVRVVAAPLPAVEVRADPTPARAGRPFTVTVTYTNRGLSAAPAPVLFLGGPGVAVGRSVADLGERPMGFLPRPTGTGPAGLLLPGESGSITLVVRLPADTPNSLPQLGVRSLLPSDRPLTAGELEDLLGGSAESHYGDRAADARRLLPDVFGRTAADVYDRLVRAAEHHPPSDGPLTVGDVRGVQLADLEERLRQQLALPVPNGTPVVPPRPGGAYTGYRTQDFFPTGAASGRVSYVVGGFLTGGGYEDGGWAKELVKRIQALAPGEHVVLVQWDSGTGLELGAEMLVGAEDGSELGKLFRRWGKVGGWAGTIFGGLAGAAADGFGYYHRKAALTRELGLDLAWDIRHRVGDPGKVTVYGHSLGAQSAGFAGAALGGLLDQIIAMDPAGPGFRGEPTTDRLDRGDARRVAVINTSTTLGMYQDNTGGPLDVGHEAYFPCPPDGFSWNVIANHSYATIFTIGQLGDDFAAGGRLVPDFDAPTTSAESCVKPGDSPAATDPAGSVPVWLVGAFDPNDYLLPPGVGAERWVPVASQAHTVRFENAPEFATAPAQEVTLTARLDPDLDPATFRLTAVGFGAYLVRVPAGRQSFATRVAAANPDGSPLWVDVDARFDPATGVLTLTLRSTDPLTGLPPLDPFAGFLPVNDGTGRGEGFVGFTVAPRAGRPTGTRFNAAADIVFDFNAPIATPPAFNTLDADPPDAVAGVDATETDRPTFTVRVGWTDAGSGVEAVDVFVSTDGGPWRLWLDDFTGVSAEFTGELGHTYAFFAVGRDRVGNVEPMPATPDVVIRVVDPLSVDAGPAITGVEGGVVSLAGVRITHRGDPTALVVTVDWGDGTIESGVLDGFGLANTHTYGDDGEYTVTVTASVATRSTTGTLRVWVANAPPVMAAVADVMLPVGGRLVRAVDFFDVGADTWTAAADYGDGRGPQPVRIDGRWVQLDAVYPAAGSYRVVLAVTDDDGGTAEVVFRVTVAARPAVGGVRVNDGSAQRSMVNSLTVTFSEVVTADVGAFEVRAADGRVVPVRVAWAVVNGVSVATLTFTGPGLEGGSVADGRYTLTVRGERVRSAATGLAVGGDTRSEFTRRFGDADGDGAVTARELFDLIRSLGSRRGQPRYHWYFDRDADGDVDLFGDVLGLRTR